MEKITITPPDGYEVQEEMKDGIKCISFVQVKTEPTDEDKLDELEEELDKFAKEKNHNHYLTGTGDVSETRNDYQFHHNTETVIRAERMWIMWRRLAEMLNEGEKGRYYVVIQNNNIIIDPMPYVNLYGFPYFKDKETAQTAVEMFGENNIIWMLQNL